MVTEYERLVEATAIELFDESKAGLPVYTLAEPDALAAITARARIEGPAAAAYLRVVRASLRLDDDQHPLSWHIYKASQHGRDPVQEPAVLPLLVVLTMAAESMQATNDMASNNYYGRLAPLLGIASEQTVKRLIADYRAHAEALWGSLNAWLEAWEGERGVPTAYVLGGMRAVGLPMSQAVVRRHDRAGLHEVFVAEGLPAGFRMGPADMELAIDPYATRQPSPLSNNLRRLWALPPARERIVQAACLELESWSGEGAARGSSAPSRIPRIVAYLRTFPRKAIEFNIAIPAEADAGTVIFVTPAGDISVPTMPGGAGSVRLASTDELSSDSMLREVLRGSIGEEGTPIERRPRRVFPLRWDELQGCFVEIERVALGEDNLIVAMADTRVRVERLLETCARPGWEHIDEMPGLPDGWIVYRQVQIVGTPDGTPHVELIPLVPRARTSLTLRGGFALPGRLRKWSSLAPPEVVALAASASTVTVRVFDGFAFNEEDVLFDETVDGELAIVRLEEHGLEDGEYAIAMFVDGATKAASTATLRLRSANSPLFNVAEVDMELVYASASGPLWPLSSTAADWPDYINGPRVQGDDAAVDVTATIHEFSPRARRKAKILRERVRLGSPLPPDSCMTTGRHRFQLPTAESGRPTVRSIEGECTTCGLVRRFAATPCAAKKKSAPKGAAVAKPVELPPVTEHAETDQHIAFDALSHIGHGNYGVFERIAGQIEGSGLFADVFLRRQEVIGHIDVRRDEYLRPIDWAVNAATLTPVGGGEWVLIGARSQQLVRSIERLLGPLGSLKGSTDAGILRVTVAADETTMHELTPALDALGVMVQPASPALDVARRLPSLSEVEVGLKRVAIPAFRSLEIWDTASASWTPATSLSATGAYRMRDFRSTYVVRSRADLETETVAVANAQLVKHIANRWSGDCLVGYHTRSNSVLTPLGADLPALYGRALSLCSGKAPREIETSRLVQYPDVPREVADAVVDRLMN